MSLQLFASDTSPFARIIRVVLLETGQSDVSIDTVATTPLATDQALMTANPLGKIPALRRHDGPTLFDSRVIARFLNDRAGGTLYPREGLYDALTLEALGHGVLEALLACTYEQRLRPDAQQSSDWIEAQWSKAIRGIRAIEAQWMSHLYGPLSLPQITIACALAYADFRHAARPWRPGLDALNTWEAEFAVRPSMQATQPPPG